MYRVAFLACYWLFFLALTPCAKPIQIMNYQLQKVVKKINNELSQMNTNKVLYMNSQNMSFSATEDSALCHIICNTYKAVSVLKSLIGLCMNHKQNHQTQVSQKIWKWEVTWLSKTKSKVLKRNGKTYRRLWQNFPPVPRYINSNLLLSKSNLS